MRTRVTLVLMVAALAFPAIASAEILAVLPSRKVCVGHDGGGINLSVFLNHGWKPSSKLWFRVRLHNPAGRLVYSYRDSIDTASTADGYDIMQYTPKRTGLFKTTFEAYGWRPTTFLTRVYRCA